MVCYDAGIDGFRRDSFDAPEFSGKGVDPVRRRIDHDADDVYVPFSVGQAHAAHDVRPEVVQKRVDLFGGLKALRQDRQYGHTIFHCDSVPLVEVEIIQILLYHTCAHNANAETEKKRI